MLEDRYYMRQSPFDSRKSATVILLIINLAVFLVDLILMRFSDFTPRTWFALSLRGLEHGFLWQLLTFQFMHDGFLHLLFNCWAIYIFGRDVEEVLGRKQFLTLYLASGIIGGLLQIGFAIVFGAGFGQAVVGASAGAFGLAAAYALLFPDRLLLLFFIIPIRAKYLLVLVGLLALIGLLSQESNIAHAAHLGGMLTGMGFIRYAIHWNWQWPKWSRGQTRSSRRLVKVISGSPGWQPKQVTSEELPPEEFLSKEVDPILDKISAHGIQSLTERERRILEAARQKMARR